jgi:outer membrane protease
MKWKIKIMDSPYYYDQHFQDRTIRVNNKYYKVAEQLDNTIITSNTVYVDGEYIKITRGRGMVFDLSDIDKIYPPNTTLKGAYDYECKRANNIQS